MEVVREIYPDTADGTSYYEVGPDRDGLRIVEIREFDNDKIVQRITINFETARLMARALNACADEMDPPTSGGGRLLGTFSK